MKTWCCRGGSNSGPPPYQGGASADKWRKRSRQGNVVGGTSPELTGVAGTYWGCCSAEEFLRRGIADWPVILALVILGLALAAALWFRDPPACDISADEPLPWVQQMRAGCGP